MHESVALAAFMVWCNQTFTPNTSHHHTPNPPPRALATSQLLTASVEFATLHTS